MSKEHNKALVQRYIDEVWNQGDLEAIPTYFDKRLAEYNAVWVPMWRRALPDARTSVDAMIAEGSYVAVHLTLRGTHLGDLTGELIRDFAPPLAPTGRRLEAAAMVIYEIVGDKIVRVPNSVMDWLTVLRQLGGVTGDGDIDEIL